jgi:hypothetical protein
MLLQCAIDNFDSTDNPRTKAAGLGKDHSHRVANSDCRSYEEAVSDLLAAAIILIRC